MHVVCGAGGFVGGHLVAELRRRGEGPIRAVDRKPRDQWFQRFDDVENARADLREADACRDVCRGARRLYNLAADMGGMGFIQHNRAACMLNVLINTHLLLAAREAGVERYFFASSACVYPQERQSSTRVVALREAQAYPADPEDGYGWEKLFAERMCRHFQEDFGLPVRVARFHNTYGTHCAWHGGREKAPAAICRKVIEAVHTGSGQIEVWGDGSQLRSYTWIDDTIEGVLRLMEADASEPVNVGTTELVSVDDLVGMVEEIGGVTLARRYRPDAPRGVVGRNSDNTRMREITGGWEPRTPLRSGLARTYAWIEGEYKAWR